MYMNIVNANVVEDSHTIQPLTGISLLFPLSCLAFATIIHPLGSSLGFDPSSQPYVRLAPISCFLDSIYFLLEIFDQGPKVAIHRRVNPRFRCYATQLPIRFVTFAVIVEQYARMCSFTGIPITFGIATILFISFLVLELWLIFGLLSGWIQVKMQGVNKVGGNYGNGGILDSSIKQCSIGPPKRISRGILFLQGFCYIVAVIYISTTTRYCVEMEIPEYNNVTSAPSPDLPTTITHCSALALILQFFKDVITAFCTLPKFIFMVPFKEAFITRFYHYLFPEGLDPNCSWLWKLPIAAAFTCFAYPPFFLMWVGMIFVSLYQAVAVLFILASAMVVIIFAPFGVFRGGGDGAMAVHKTVMFWTVLGFVAYYGWIWDGEGTGRKEWGKFLP